MSTTKTLAQVHRGDKVLSPRGLVTVTSITHNWAEDFRNGHNTKGVETTTLVGILPNGNQVTLTAPNTRVLEVAE